MFLLLTLHIFLSLILGLADYLDYLVWLGKERLNSFISRRSHGHWLKCYSVELIVSVSYIHFSVSSSQEIVVHIINSTAAVTVAVSLLLEIKFWPEMKILTERVQQIWSFTYQFSKL